MLLLLACAEVDLAAAATVGTPTTSQTSTTAPTSTTPTGTGTAGSTSTDTTDTWAEGRRVPAEWEPQEAVWLQWPRSYERTYEPALARVVATLLRFEHVHVLAHDERTRESSVAALQAEGGLTAAEAGGGPTPEGFVLTWHDVPNDSAWMRDNGPVWVEVDGERRLQDWGFDAWGGAFGPFVTYDDDDAVPAAVGALTGTPVDAVALVHERGNLELNGVDTLLLNWSVVGDPERNPGLTREAAEAVLGASLGVTRVVWVEGVPSGDLTRGHIDGFARFVTPDRVVVADCSPASACQPGSPDDDVYDGAAQAIEAAGLTVERFPFYGKVPYGRFEFDTDYMNWLVANGVVITVGFGHPEADADAATRIGGWFPDREVVVIEMLESWAAGGGVHCHTNDQPAKP